MTIDVIHHVWEKSKSKGCARLVLLAIADNANILGDAFPGVDRIARKSNMSVRSTQLAIQELERAGELQVYLNVGTKTISGWTNLYRVVLPDVKQSEVRTHDGKIVNPRPLTVKKERSLIKEVQPVTPLVDGVQPVTPHEVNPVAPDGVQPVTPKPSEEPSVQPSVLKTSADKPASPFHSIASGDQIVKQTKATSIEEIRELAKEIERANEAANPGLPAPLKKQTKEERERTPAENVGLSSLIMAWLEETKIVEPDAIKNSTKRKEAVVMFRLGITADDMKAFIRYKKTQDYWKENPVLWRHVTAGIMGWKDREKQKVAVSDPSFRKLESLPDNPDAIPMPPEALAAFQETIKALSVKDKPREFQPIPE